MGSDLFGVRRPMRNLLLKTPNTKQKGKDAVADSERAWDLVSRFTPAGCYERLFLGCQKCHQLRRATICRRNRCAYWSCW